MTNTATDGLVDTSESLLRQPILALLQMITQEMEIIVLFLLLDLGVESTR